MVSAMARVISSTERIASSLPAIGTVIRSGSAFVSTMEMIGMPSLFASATAIFSFFASTTNMRPGVRVSVRMPLRYLDSFSFSRVIIRRSFFV